MGWKLRAGAGSGVSLVSTGGGNTNKNCFNDTDVKGVQLNVLCHMCNVECMKKFNSIYILHVFIQVCDELDPSSIRAIIQSTILPFMISLQMTTFCPLFNIFGMVRFRMVKKWFPQNTFFSWFFTGWVFIMVYYIIKLDLEFQLDLQNPLKQPKMWIYEKWKI